VGGMPESPSRNISRDLSGLVQDACGQWRGSYDVDGG
jgi:hypothetical protein